MAAYPKETREKLRRLYVHEGRLLESAASMCQIPPATARAWRKKAKDEGDDWDKVRAAYLLAGDGIENLSRAILTGFLQQYDRTMTMLRDESAEELPPSERVRLLASLADAFTKTAAANARMLPETSKLAVALEVLELFGSFIGRRYPQHLPAFVEMVEPLGAEIEQKYR